MFSSHNLKFYHKFTNLKGSERGSISGVIRIRREVGIRREGSVWGKIFDTEFFPRFSPVFRFPWREWLSKNITLLVVRYQDLYSRAVPLNSLSSGYEIRSFIGPCLWVNASRRNHITFLLLCGISINTLLVSLSGSIEKK